MPDALSHPSSSPVEVGIALALASHYSSSTAILGAMARIPCNAERTLVTRTITTNYGGIAVRKVIIALMISAAIIVSGLSTTTFSTGQLTNIAWGEGGGE